MECTYTRFFEGFAISGVIVRDTHGTIKFTWTGRTYAATAFEAEAIAGSHALSLAEDLQLEKSTFEGDSVNVILALNGVSSRVEWQGKHAILQGKSVLPRHMFWSRSHVNCSCNRAAHNLAQWARNCNSFGYVDPGRLLQSVLRDRGGTSESFCNPLTDVNEYAHQKKKEREWNIGIPYHIVHSGTVNGFCFLVESCFTRYSACGKFVVLVFVWRVRQFLTVLFFIFSVNCC